MISKEIRFIFVLCVGFLSTSFGSQWPAHYNQWNVAYAQPQMPHASVQAPCSNYVFFWQVPADILSGKRVLSAWEMDESCLSQWYPSEFTVCGATFYNSEQFMMYCKAIFCKDYSTAGQILRTASPDEIKKLGRQVAPFDPNWDKCAADYVELGNIEKFRQNPILKDYLISTGTKVLVEASPYDKIWGIGLSKDDPKACDWRQWQGENKLGTILDTIKDTFIEYDNPFRPLLDRFDNINLLIQHIKQNGLKIN